MNSFLKDCTDIQIGFDDNTQPVSRYDIGRSRIWGDAAAMLRKFIEEGMPEISSTSIYITDVIDTNPYTVSSGYETLHVDTATAAGLSVGSIGNINIGANAGMDMTYSSGAWSVDGRAADSVDTGKPAGWLDTLGDVLMAEKLEQALKNRK